MHSGLGRAVLAPAALEALGPDGARRLAGPLFLRLGLLGLVLLNPWAPHLLAVLGLFDTWADFRKLRKPAASARDSELT